MYIPKPDGKIATVGDPHDARSGVQTAAMLVLEPIFEADLPPEQYAYRAGTSALDAVRARAQAASIAGTREVVDADLSGYFDSDSARRADEVGGSPGRRRRDAASDQDVAGGCRSKRRTSGGTSSERRRNRDEGRGTPQGSPISPLLANLYMRRFVLGWKTVGHDQAAGSRTS